MQKQILSWVFYQLQESLFKIIIIFVMEPEPNNQKEIHQKQVENPSQIGTNHLDDQMSQDQSDDVFEEQSEQDPIDRPRNQVITEDECFDDDEIEDSDESLVQQEQSIIADSDQQQQKQQEAEEKNMSEKQAVKYKHRLKLFDYQNILFNRSLGKNRIIYLPTGKGKTLVSIASMYYYLCKEGEEKKIIFLANTIQLVKQQADSIKRNLERIMDDPDLSSSLRKQGNPGKVKWTSQQIKHKVCCIHGQKTDQIGMTRRKKIEAQLTSKKQILELFKKSTIIVMIAQMFLNCLRRGYIKLTDFSFMVFDQCHHCHGNHPYAGIMRQFYFSKPKLDAKVQKQNQMREIQLKLPIIMGLTASPVTLQTFDKDKLVKQISQLCGNLDSRFTSYEIDKIKSDTVIQIIKAVESQEREQVPDLIAHFEKFRDHREAYDKIRKHFPKYFQCVKKVIDFLKSKYETQLDLEADPYTISDVQLLLFYDVKECLLVKLRDVWLQLGQYAFSIAFQELYIELGKISLKNEQNKLILNQVMKIIKEYIIKFKKQFGQCKDQFFSAKVKQLIKLLSQKSSQTQSFGLNQFEMVVVFASKRRTVKYLEKIIKNYKQTLPEQEKISYQCDKVTGYSIRTLTDYSKNQVIFDADPSSFRFYAQAEHRYNAYLNDLEEEKKNNRNAKTQSKEAESSNLANQLRRMRSVKYGKLLLQVQEKYSTQIETIKRFRAKKFRVLITTSVTQQGFDIPECKIVISFDKPSSLKSYIQIKGRARQQYSKYFIFTTERNYKDMLANKQFYDDIINATFEISINKFSQNSNEQNKGPPAIVRQQQGYRSVTVRETGAVINTSYALQIFKTYCASLRTPNKPRFYFIQTPNVAFRCLIYFPATAPTSKPYITGQSKSSKHQALKSAAFEAVKYLYTQKYIKTDLRPKKYEELQDQREIQRFQDLQQTRRNDEYKKIFEEEVRIKCEMVKDRKFMRFYFKTLASPDLDFHLINPLFKNHKEKFEKQKFPFQIYMMNFSNSRNLKQLKKDDDSQQIGVLTCFESKYNQQIFSGYEYSFEENSAEKFTLKLEEDNLLLVKSEYERLKRIHQFIVTAALGRQVSHYSHLTGKKPIPNKWISEKEKSDLMKTDEEREYYPILVILKKKNGNYYLDQQCNKNIEQHENIFKQIYQYHNKIGKQNSIQKFRINLTKNYQKLLSEIRINKFDQSLIVQSLEKQHCFSKCIISGKQIYTQSMQKNKDKKKSLSSRNKKMKMMFDHAQDEIKQVVKIVFWAKYKKQKKKQIFERDGKLTIKDVQNPRYYLASQYCIYPISTALLFKATLATQFLFKAVFQYSLALFFRNYKLPNIFKTKIKETNVNQDRPFCFTSYPSVILENGVSIFKYLAQNSSSQYLRNIGKSYEQGTKFFKPTYQFSLSKINMSVDESSILHNNKPQQGVNNSMEMSQLGFSKILDNSLENHNMSFENDNNKSISDYTEQKSMNLVTEIKINEILKVLTSRMYKFNKLDNYEEYQFIGDVVLKMLSTVQIFLEKPISDESQLHISRANIICNANLHRKAILKHIYRYILTKKCDQLPPPYVYNSVNNIEQENYEKTTFKKYNQNTQIQGFHYIPGKVHADIVQALIGAFYLHSRDLNDCQILLYTLDILKKPMLKINFDNSRLPFGTKALPKIFQDFEDRFQYHFKNKGLLIQALTHSSFKSILNTVIDKNSIKQVLQSANKSFASQASFLSTKSKQINQNATTRTVPWETFYQRLEFLGDSILDLIVVEYLHDKYGSKDQGTLTALKQAGVSNKTLGMIAINYGMHELILMDYPENDKVMKEFQKIVDNFNTYLNNPEALMDAKVNSIKILGDVFEALVGAIFVDLELDYVATKAVIMKRMKDFLIHYTDMETLKKSSNYKYQQFLNKNNYRECQLKKDTTQEIQNGNFKFLLIDRSGAIIDQCWQTTEKRAWDVILEKFYKKNLQSSQ